MSQVILKGTQKQIDTEYDRLFSQLDRTAFLENKVSSENEFASDDSYIVEFKQIPQSVQEWIEAQSNMELVL